MDEENTEKALSVYRKMTAHFPDSYIGYFFIGKILSKQGKLSEAEKEFKKTLEIEPLLLEPRFELLDIYKKQDAATGEKHRNKTEVIGLYKEILEQYPNDARAAIELGLYYHRIGEKKEADIIFKDLADRNETDRTIIEKIMFLFVRQKQYEEAVTVLDGMLKHAPDSSDIHYVAGISRDGLKKNDEAIRHFQKVKPDSVFYENAAFFIATLYQMEGKKEEAVKHLEMVIRQIPENPDFFLYLGQFYEEEENYEKAETILKQGLEVNADNMKLIFRLGVIYDKWGKKEASIERMKTVVQADPKNAQALNYLGYTYLDLDIKIDEAEELIKKAVALEPKDGYIMDSLGWLVEAAITITDLIQGRDDRIMEARGVGKPRERVLIITESLFTIAVAVECASR